MALDPLEMRVVGQGPSRLFIYNTTDNIAGAGYFNAMANTLLVGDMIMSSNGTAVNIYAVSSNDGSTVVVVRHAVT